MAEVLRLVVDNSVAAKWGIRFSDEDFLPESLAVLGDFLAGRVGLIGPYLLAYEQGSSLRAAARRRRITEEASRRELNDFLRLSIPLVYDPDILRRALELSVQFGSAYSDSVYLALAEATGFPLLHADDRLRNALASRFARELWIGDYVPVG